ncbi:MAG: hypothetical protein U0236_08195 [Nitrospira sp.]
MKQRRIMAVLAILAITGAVSVPKSFAVTWRLDIGERHVVDQGGSEWDQLIHRVADTDVPPNAPWPQSENYSRYGSQLAGLREHGVSQSDRSGYGMQYQSGSAGEERPYGTPLHGNYFRNDRSSAYPTAPYSEMTYGGPPTTPNADPMIKELSREPSVR